MRPVLFIGLSLAAHALLLWPPGPAPVRPPGLAAPPLSVTVATAPRARPTAPARGAGAPRPAPARVVAQRRAGAERNRVQALNHLRGMLQARLARQFVYPLLARKYGWEGEVRVAIALDAGGVIRHLRLARSSGHAVLDRNALDSLARIGRLPEARPWLAGRGLTLELPVRYRLRG